MANPRTDMRKVRELLRLKFEQDFSIRAASSAVGIGKTAGSEYIACFRKSGLSISDLTSLSDDELIQAIAPVQDQENERYKHLCSLFPYFEKELKRTGVTLQLLWQEYLEKTKEGYGYSQFCHHFSNWQKRQKVSMHIDHKAGDKMYVDFAGNKALVTNPDTGELISVEVFVAVLGACQRAYIEAVPSQKVADWVYANENALHYYGGVPRAIVPDCLKSAVIKANKYEPVINDTFRDFAAHYNTAVVPARALHPRIKAWRRILSDWPISAFMLPFATIFTSLLKNLTRLYGKSWKSIITPLSNKRIIPVQNFLNK